jgi:hypothetical protein
MSCARARVKEMIVATIKEKLANDPEFLQERLSDDEKEAAIFFGVL